MPERGPTRKAPCYYFNDTVRFTSEQIPSHTNIFLLGQRLANGKWCASFAFARQILCKIAAS